MTPPNAPIQRSADEEAREAAFKYALNRTPITGQHDGENLVAYEGYLAGFHARAALSEESEKRAVKDQWENAADRISLIASMLSGAKAKMSGNAIAKALYGIEDEFRELGEKLSTSTKAARKETK